MKKYSLLICLIALIHNAANATRITEVADSLDTSAEVADSTEVIQLDGVEIVAAREIHKGDHDVLLLSEDNRKFGTNALDAISSLNRFETMLNSRTLTNNFKENVYILINGVPSDGDILRTYKGEDIKKVEYYSVAPPKYAIFTFGPIINVITSKKRDQQYDGYFNTTNAVNTGYGFNQAALTYTDSLNRVKIGYWHDYRNTGRISEHSEFNYDLLGRKAIYDTRRRYEGILHNISTEYQRFQGKHLFNVSIVGKIEPGEDNSSGTAQLFDDKQVYNGTKQSHLKSRVNSIKGDLYYGYTDGQTSFAVSFSNSFGKSYSDAWSEMTIPEPYSQYSYKNSSRLDNDSYALTAYALVNTPWNLIGGSFSAVASYNYSQIEQRYLGTKVAPSYSNLFVNTAMFWNVNGFYFNEMLGANVTKENNGFETRTTFAPRITLYCNYWSPTISHLGIDLQLGTTKAVPKLNDLSESSSYIDNWFVATGNPDLKANWQTWGTLRFHYYPKNTRNSITFRLQTNYFDNVYNTCLFYDNDIVRSIQYNLTYKLYASLYLSGTWSPFKWLAISPYITYSYRRLGTPDKRVVGEHVKYGGNVTLTHKNVSLVLAANSSGRSWDGDIVTRYSAQFAAVVQYSLRNWTIGAEWHYSSHNDYEKGSIKGFDYIVNTDRKPMHNLIQLNAVYSFTIGHSRKHDQKKISSGMDADSGLNKYNNVQID